MRIGFGLPVSGSWSTGDNLLGITLAGERMGYDSVWAFQRLPAPSDKSIPPAYRQVLDPVVALSLAAAVTRRAELGVAVLNLPFASPALVAKQFASLDVLSQGRAVLGPGLGLGLGWLPLEFEVSVAPYRGRGARAEEYLRCLAAPWGPDPVHHDGAQDVVPESSALPKPIRPGGIPVLLGGRRTGPLTGPLEQVRDDVGQLEGQGVTEVFVDLNFDPTIGQPDVPAEASMDRAREVLATLAPDRAK